MELNGARALAVVDVYYPTSAAVGTKLDTARAAFLEHEQGELARRPRPEAKFALDKQPGIDGVKVRLAEGARKCACAELYFFRTPNWVITVRRARPAGGQAFGHPGLDTIRGRCAGTRWIPIPANTTSP